MLINETNVKCFLSLANTLSFTKTATDLYMTQQAVSKNISKLEESMGLALFDRSRHAVTLTDAGRRFHILFSRFCYEYELALKDAGTHSGDFGPTVNIGYQNWLDFGRAPGRALAASREKFPGLSLVGERHSPVILTEQLLAGKMDLIMLYDHFVSPVSTLQSRPILTSPALLMVSLDHPLMSPDATWETFRREPFIFDSFENEKPAEVNERARRAIAAWGLQPSQVIFMPNRDSAYTAAELGRGIIITTRLNRISRSSTLKAFPIDKLQTIVCVWQRGKLSPAAQEYIEQLAREYHTF